MTGPLRLLPVLLLLLSLTACAEAHRRGGEGGGAEGEGEGTEGEGEGAEGEGEGAEGEGEGEGAEGEGEGEGSGPCLRGDKKCVGDDLYYCVDSDEWLLLEECASLGQTCEGGKCVGCEPGTKLCRGQSVVECQDDGKTELVAEVCGEGSECKSGACVTSCSMGGGKISYQGCEYWAVDLENADIEPGDGAVSPADAQFGVVISNTDSHNVANVKIYRMVNGIENLVMERDVPPRTEGSSGIEIFELPASNGLVGSSKGTRAFRVVTSAPVIAYQFNPLHNTEQAFSNDASLLLPTDALDREYLVTTGDGIKLGVSLLETVDAGSYVVVVGVTPEPAQVTIEASVDVVNVQARDVTVVGRTVTASVGRYEVLAVSSRVPGAGTAGEGNLSGTRVIADRPVAVFSGNVATVVPAGPDSKCCADHLEEQIFPLSSWGRRFVAPHSLVRRVSGVAETDGWRITAAEAATTLHGPLAPHGKTEKKPENQHLQEIGRVLPQVQHGEDEGSQQSRASGDCVTPGGTPEIKKEQSGKGGKNTRKEPHHGDEERRKEKRQRTPNPQEKFFSLLPYPAR